MHSMRALCTSGSVNKQIFVGVFLCSILNFSFIQGCFFVCFVFPSSQVMACKFCAL